MRVSKENVGAAISSQLNEIKQKFSKLGANVIISDDVRDFFLNQYYPQMSFAMIECIIRQDIKEPLAEMVLFDLKQKVKNSFRIEVVEGNSPFLRIRYKKEEINSSVSQ